MKRPDREDLISKALQSRLSAAEQDEWDRLLREDPKLRESFAEETALDRALDRLPDVSISSNFTALVLQAALKEERPAETRGMRVPFFRSVLARVTGGIAVISLVGFGLAYQYRKAEERANMALSVRSFTEVASVIGSEQTPPEQLFQDFEAIQRLSLPSEAEVDMELLVALQR